MNDTSPEMEKMQYEMMQKLTPNQRIAMACEMYAAVRQLAVNSLPKDLSEREMKRQIYFRTYGEHLPDDFFKD